MNKKLLFIVLLVTSGLHAAQGDAPPPAQPLMTEIEDKWQCDFCGKVMKLKSNMKVHLRTHTDERPYKCPHPGCPKAFKRQYHLKEHQRSHTGERPYRCTQPGCGEVFSQQSTLMKHKKTHTGERPYRCSYPECCQAFTQSGNLKRHISEVHKVPLALPLGAPLSGQAAPAMPFLPPTPAPLTPAPAASASAPGMNYSSDDDDDYDDPDVWTEE